MPFIRYAQTEQETSQASSNTGQSETGPPAEALARQAGSTLDNLIKEPDFFSFLVKYHDKEPFASYLDFERAALKGPVYAGLGLGSLLGAVGAIPYVFTSPTRRKRPLRNLLVYVPMGAGLGAAAGYTLGNALGPLYYAWQGRPYFQKFLRQAESVVAPQELPHLRAATERILYHIPRFGAPFVIGTVGGFLAGSAYGLGSKERRKEWFKNMLVYGTLGSFLGFLSAMPVTAYMGYDVL